MAKDKLQHLGMGMLTILGMLAALGLYRYVGLGAALAFSTTAVGILYEVQQWYRKEGRPDWRDALATAAPGWLAWGVLA